MSHHVSAYRAACAKILDDPLGLTDHDFAVLESFSRADEKRGREALKTAQLKLLEPSLVTKGIAPRPASARRERASLDDIGTVIGLALKAGIAPVRADVDRLTREMNALRAEHAQLTARNRQLEDDNRTGAAIIEAFQELVREMDHAAPVPTRATAHASRDPVH